MLNKYKNGDSTWKTLGPLIGKGKEKELWC